VDFFAWATDCALTPCRGVVHNTPCSSTSWLTSSSQGPQATWSPRGTWCAFVPRRNVSFGTTTAAAATMSRRRSVEPACAGLGLTGTPPCGAAAATAAAAVAARAPGRDKTEEAAEEDEGGGAGTAKVNSYRRAAAAAACAARCATLAPEAAQYDDDEEVAPAAAAAAAVAVAVAVATAVLSCTTTRFEACSAAMCGGGRLDRGVGDVGVGRGREEEEGCSTPGTCAEDTTRPRWGRRCMRNGRRSPARSWWYMYRPAAVPWARLIVIVIIVIVAVATPPPPPPREPREPRAAPAIVVVPLPPAAVSGLLWQREVGTPAVKASMTRSCCVRMLVQAARPAQAALSALAAAVPLPLPLPLPLSLLLLVRRRHALVSAALGRRVEPKAPLAKLPVPRAGLLYRGDCVLAVADTMPQGTSDTPRGLVFVKYEDAGRRGDIPMP